MKKGRDFSRPFFPQAPQGLSTLTGAEVIFKSVEADTMMTDGAVASGATDAAFLEIFRHVRISFGDASLTHDLSFLLFSLCHDGSPAAY